MFYFKEKKDRGEYEFTQTIYNPSDRVRDRNDSCLSSAASNVSGDEVRHNQLCWILSPLRKGDRQSYKNFTGQYYKGDIIPVEGVQLKIHYFPQQDVVRVKFMSDAVDDETGENYQYADWTPGQSRRLRVGKSIIVVTLNRIFQHEKEETQVELPWFNNDPPSPWSILRYTLLIKPSI